MTVPVVPPATAPDADALAASLLEAWDTAALRPLPSAQGLDWAGAWAVAERLRARRVARGERVAGWKTGFTNRSLWPRYGVYQPMWAPVWDGTLTLLDGTEATLSLAGLSQPRLEPEIVFGLARSPEPGMTLDALHACLGWVAHGVEVVHTHFDGWRFTAADTVADFGLHGRLLVGPRVAPWPTLADDLAALELELQRDGTPVDHGAGRVVLDGPLQALKSLVDAMAATTPLWRIGAGDVVTTGTLTDAWPLAPGQRWSTRLSLARLPGLEITAQS